jgi:hypothetical protein
MKIKVLFAILVVSVLLWSPIFPVDARVRAIETGLGLAEQVSGGVSREILKTPSFLTYKFTLGDRVQSTASVYVREGPGLSYLIIKTEPIGATGVVVCSKPQQSDDYMWWVIKYSDGTRGWSAENWLERTGAISIITNLPMTYIHQCYDTRDDFDGRWACGATSAVMALAYYAKIDSWPYTCSYPYTHVSNFGNYISQEYMSCTGYTFDTITNDAGGRPAVGAYGYIHYPDGLAKLDRMVSYFQKHDLDSEWKYNPSESEVKAELDSGYPVPASTKLTQAGHWIVIKGYAEGYYVVNDPNGCKPYKGDQVWGLDFNYCGENVLYTWDEMKVNEKWIAKVHPKSTPVYTVTFYTDPSSVGSITFAGTIYTNGQTGQYAGGSYAVAANAPSGYVFSNWVTTGGVTISGSTATVSGAGTLTAIFRSVVTAVHLSDFDQLFTNSFVRVIFPADTTPKPLGCFAAMTSDWTASGFVQTKLDQYVEGLDTAGNFVDQSSGRPQGNSGDGILTFGGWVVNPVVKYAESGGTPSQDRAPIKSYVSGGTIYFQRSDGSSIPGANLPCSVINYGEDMFVMEVFKDSSGRNIMICYGFGWKGSYAAGKFFNWIYPSISSYNCGWIIVKWQDTNGDTFVNAPGGGDTYTEIAREP